jgi:hypothetical protein
MENKFDLEKFGFKLVHTHENGGLNYELKMNPPYFSVVTVVANTFTITMRKDDKGVEDDYEPTMYVANRYKVETQDQLDFLILNGRIGWWFKQVPA